MAQFTLDPEALAGKYEALREDVQGDRDVMHKRIATLEELNKEAHRKYAELQKRLMNCSSRSSSRRLVFLLLRRAFR